MLHCVHCREGHSRSWELEGKVLNYKYETVKGQKQMQNAKISHISYLHLNNF